MAYEKGVGRTLDHNYGLRSRYGIIMVIVVGTGKWTKGCMMMGREGGAAMCVLSLCYIS